MYISFVKRIFMTVLLFSTFSMFIQGLSMDVIEPTIHRVFGGNSDHGDSGLNYKYFPLRVLCRLFMLIFALCIIYFILPRPNGKKTHMNKGQKPVLFEYK